MEYILIRAARRSMSLQVRPTGEIVVRAPRFAPKFLIDRFVDGHITWIDKRKKDLAKPKVVASRQMSDEELKRIVKEHVELYARHMKVTPQGIRFRKVSSYWGSCSPMGVLSFNLRLAFTPADAIEYVVVHELAHLRWHGHGRKFWDLVVKTFPRTNEMRRVLRQIPRE